MRRSRLLIGIAMAVAGLVSYYGYRQVNPVTGETQHISLTQDQEVPLGLQRFPSGVPAALSLGREITVTGGGGER